jgi:photosystem II stability/assembly factor-like uncharacterized protein
MRGVAKLGTLVAVLLTAALPADAHAQVLGGHAGWFWGNPLPQGHSLTSVELQGGRGYAGGDFGTLIRTDDGGASWRGLATGFTQNVERVRMISANSVVIGGGCALRRSDDGGASFNRLPWTAGDARCTSALAAFAFPSGDVGYIALQNGNVLRTSDGGRTWRRRTAVPGTLATDPKARVQPSDIVFTSTDAGFVAAAGTVYSTPDGGQTWTPVAAAPLALHAIAFPDAAHGYAVGDGGTVLLSADGGATWTTSNVGDTAASLTGIDCVSTTCVATSKAGDRLFRSADAGATWTAVFAATERLFAAAAGDAAHVVAVGADGATVISGNAGVTFTRVGGRVFGTYQQVQAPDKTHAYAFGLAGALARTENGGTTWEDLGAATSDRVVSVSFPTARIGFALDAVGQLLRTDNAAQSWQILNPGAGSAPRAVAALDSRRVLLIGPKGIRRSTTGGQAFARVAEQSLDAASLGRVDRVGRSVFAYGPRAIFRSTDGGASWHSVKRPKGSNLQTVDFVSAGRGFALLADGSVMTTRNRGRSWGELSAIGTEVGFDLAFSDARHGFVTVPEFGDDEAGYVMATSDGGATWRPQLIDSAQLHRGSLAAPAAGTAFVLAGADHLFATHEGGDSGARSTLTISASRKAAKPGLRTIQGHLKPARGGEQVVVSIRERGSHEWLFNTVQVASNGTFTVVADVRRTSTVVAQWRGDDVRQGDGSAPLTLSVKR